MLKDGICAAGPSSAPSEPVKSSFTPILNRGSVRPYPQLPVANFAMMKMMVNWRTAWLATMRM